MRTNRIQLFAAPIVSALMVVALGAGCPDVDGSKKPPIVSAGGDQSVAPGALVTLSGSGSDPDGGAVSFEWSQTSGTAVVLSNANFATASFTAPATDGTLGFRLTVTDSSNATATDDVTVTVSSAPPPAVSKTLYVANLTGNSVTGYTLTTPNDINGNIAPISNLNGANTNITAPRGLTLDANKAMQVGNDGNNSITSYGSAENPANLNGNIFPLRNVQGAASAVNILRGITREASTDLMYVSDAGAPASIRVFTGASTAAFNGNLAPVRTITNAVLVQPRGIAISTTGELYIANENPPRVFVYANASTLNGNIAPTRIIQTATLNAARDVFLDNAGRLFVVDNADDQVLVYNNAATINGVVAPDVTLTVPGANVLNSVITDSAGVGYISDRVGNRVYSYDHLATRNGTITPDRTLQGANTLLNQPYNLVIVE
jgi:K319L-like, PKD domain